MNLPFRFRKTTEYGLVMVAQLAQRGKGNVMSVREMQDLGLPRSFLVKIAKELVDHGIIGAKEGRGGGYYLTIDPQSVKIREVVAVLEGKEAVSQCIHGARCSFGDRCPHKSVMRLLGDELAAALSRHAVAELVTS